MSLQEINVELLKRLQKPKRRKKGERKKRTPRQKLVKDILKVWSQIVRKLTGRICPYCKMRPVADAHHIIVRGTSVSGGWFDLDNGVGLCKGCHRFQGPHCGDPVKVLRFQKWIEEVWLPSRGIDYETLYIRCRAKMKYTAFDLDFILKDLKKSLQSV